MGFSVIFAGQDLPAFQKASKEEAASIFANTNIKVCMKLEDPTETWDFFSKTAGEAYVTVARSYNMGNDGNAFGYKDTREAGIEKRARIDLMDLKEQAPGEAHIFFKSTIVRAKMFYANPPKSKQLRVNQFIKNVPVAINKVDLLKLSYSGGVKLSKPPKPLELSPDLVAISELAKLSAIEDLQTEYMNYMREGKQNLNNIVSKIKAQLLIQLHNYQNSLLFLHVDPAHRASNPFNDLNYNESVIDEDMMIQVMYKVGINSNYVPQRIFAEILQLYQLLLKPTAFNVSDQSKETKTIKLKLESFSQRFGGEINESDYNY